jgi:MFS family permease
MTQDQVATARRWAPSIPVLIVVGCAISALNGGPRSTMGFFLTPMTSENGWGREVFALAIAIQNLAWGVAQPFVGMIADKLGPARVLTFGTLLYAVGLVLMANTSSPIALQFTAGVLVGVGIAGSALFLVMAAMARMLPERLRTTAYGLVTAAASAGQLIFAPLGQALIINVGWHAALLAMAALVLIAPLLAFVLRGAPAPHATVAGQRDQSIMQALREAFTHPSYRLLVAGFFVCGFQISFIVVHLPPYLNDIGLAAYGGLALALIGLCNIAGSISTGVLSGKMPRRWILSVIYLGRAVFTAAFLLLPPTPVTVIGFAILMGFLWLSTVPPTQQLVAIMFGTRYMATLFGFVFFSHQVGSFLGVWLGGLLYDRTGSYDVVWWLSVALGVFAAIVHMPIREVGVARPAVAATG